MRVQWSKKIKSNRVIATPILTSLDLLLATAPGLIILGAVNRPLALPLPTLRFDRKENLSYLVREILKRAHQPACDSSSPATLQLA